MEPSRPSVSSQEKQNGVLFMIVAGLTLGTSGTISRFAPAAALASPLTLACVRMGLGGVLLCLLSLARTRNLDFLRSRSAILASICVCLNQSGFFMAMDSLGVALGTMLVNSSSIGMAGLFGIFLDERPSRLWWTAATLGIAGCVLAACRDAVAGFLCCLMAALGCASIVILRRMTWTELAAKKRVSILGMVFPQSKKQSVLTPEQLIPIIGIVGVVLLSYLDVFVVFRLNGLLFSLLGGLGYADLDMISKHLDEHSYSPIESYGAAMFYGALLLLPLVLFGNSSWLTTTRGIVSALALGFFPTALPVFFFTAALTRISLTQTYAISLLESVTAALLGMFLLSERLSGVQTVGMTLAFACIVLSNWDAVRKVAQSAISDEQV